MITLKVGTFAKVIPVITVNMIGIPFGAALFSVKPNGPFHRKTIFVK